MQNESLAKKIYKESHLVGNFKLRSGKISNEYFDKYLFESNPELLGEIAKAMQSNIPENVDAIAGLEMGGIPIATAISLEKNINVLFVRKVAKNYGTCKLAEGGEINNKKICIIEDVVTTGGQIIKSVNELREKGCIIDTVLCVILRDTAAIDLLKAEGLQLIPLFTMEYLQEVSR